MDWVVQIGLVELALGGLLGWAMVIREERPEWLRRIGVVAPQRIRQVHLDYVMMGLILIGVGLAVPDLPTAVAVALVFGTVVNPFLFVPLAFDPDVEKRLWYRALAVVSFLGVSGGLVAAAIVGPAIRRPTPKDKSPPCRASEVPLLGARRRRRAARASRRREATLVYVKQPVDPTVFVANDDGSGATEVEAGEQPAGLARRRLVAYPHEGSGEARN